LLQERGSNFGKRIFGRQCGPSRILTQYHLKHDVNLEKISKTKQPGPRSRRNAKLQWGKEPGKTEVTPMIRS